MSTAHWTASSALPNSAKNPSPIVLKTRPRCSDTLGSIKLWRRSRSRRSVPTSSCSIRWLYETTSVARIAAKCRSGLTVGSVFGSDIVASAPSFVDHPADYAIDAQSPTDILHVPAISGQDRAFDRFGQPRITVVANEGPSKPLIDGARTLTRISGRNSQPVPRPERRPLSALP